MSNEDYREKIEEHRQLIQFEEQQNSRMSRSRRTVKKKKRKNPLMTILLFLLLGIPFMILIYVSFFYNPSEAEIAEKEDDGTVVELQTNNIVTASSNEKEAAVIESEQADEVEDKENAEEEEVQVDTQTEVTDVTKEHEQEKEEEQQSTNGQTHTVQPNENLFRIAMKYYNDPSGVEKIKAANHLSSESISVGQTLIIPN